MIDFDEDYEIDRKGEIQTVIIERYEKFCTIVLVRKSQKVDKSICVSENVATYINDLKTYCNNYQIECVEYKRGKK